MTISRRQALALFGAGGAMAALPVQRAQAQSTTAAGVNGGGFNRLKIGDATVTVLSDGQSAPGALLPNWGANPDKKADFEKTLQDNFINPAAARNNFNPVLIDTGKNKVLIDTGFGPQAATSPTGRLLAHLAAAGVKPEEIDTVFLTHWHGDHISGVTDATGKAIFPNAKLVMGESDYQFATTAQAANASVAKNLVATKDRFTLIKTGAEIAPGITTVDSPGHTPGHQSVLVASGNQQMLVFGDAAGHYILSLQYPEQYLGFDADKEMVVKTRAKLFDRVASEKMLVTGYHFPWPAVGYIRARGAGGYEYVPAPFSF